MSNATELQTSGTRRRYFLRIEGHKDVVWQPGDAPADNGQLIDRISPPGPHGVTDDCLALWRFDEYVAGTTCADETGAYPGTPVSSPAIATGQHGRAIVAASGDYVTVTTDARWHMQRFTVAAWLYPNTVTPAASFQTWFRKKHGASQNSIILTTQGANTRIRADVEFTDGTSASAVASSNMSAGAWHHVVVTWDGSTLTVYVDGASVATATSAKTIRWTTAYGLAIGADQDAPTTYYFDGRISDVAVYTECRSADWVKRTYKGGVNYSRPGIECLELSGESTLGLDVDKAIVNPSALEIRLREFPDYTDRSTYYWAKRLAPGRWSTATNKSTWIRRKSLTTHFLDANATTIYVHYAGHFAASGEAYIGPECFSYESITTTAGLTKYDSSTETLYQFSTCTKGIYPALISATSWGRTYRYAKVDASVGDQGESLYVSSVPYTWVGKQVALYVTTWDPDNETWHSEANAQLVWFGTITDAVAWDPQTLTWKLTAEHIQQQCETKIANDLPTSDYAKLITGKWIAYSGRGTKVVITAENASGIVAYFKYTFANRTDGTGLTTIVQEFAKALNDTANWTGSAIGPGGLPYNWVGIQKDGKIGISLGVSASGFWFKVYVTTWIDINTASTNKDEQLPCWPLLAMGFTDNFIMTVSDTADAAGVYFAHFDAQELPATFFTPLHPSCNGSQLLTVAFPNGEDWTDQGDYGTARVALLVAKARMSSRDKEVAPVVLYASARATAGILYKWTLDAYQPHLRSTDAYLIHRASSDSKGATSLTTEVYVPQHQSSAGAIRGPYELLLFSLLSTGTTNYNSSTYDKLPYTLGVRGVPSSVVDTASFLAADKRALGHGIDLALRQQYIIAKPLPWLDMVTRENRLFGNILAWHKGKLTIKSLVAPDVHAYTETITDSIGVEGAQHFPVSSQSMSTVINQFECRLDYDYVTDKFYQPITINDVASQATTGQIKATKIEHPGVYLVNGAPIKALLETALSKYFDLFRLPSPVITRSIPITFLNRVHVGDYVRFTSSYVPDPFGSGSFSTAAYALVTNLAWNFRKGEGTVTLLLCARYDAATKVPWAASALVDMGATNGGWDDANDRLTLVARMYNDDSNESHDGAALSPSGGEYINIIWTHPTDPVSGYQMWGPIQVTSYTPGTRILQLANGTTLTGWNADREYIVVPADYGNATAAQRLANAFQASQTTGLLNSADDAQRYG